MTKKNNRKRFQLKCIFIRKYKLLCKDRKKILEKQKNRMLSQHSIFKTNYLKTNLLKQIKIISIAKINAFVCI